MEHFVEFENVSKYYQTGSVRIAAADHLNFYVDKGEFCIIVGPSGAGKTTLLNILGGMGTCEEGAETYTCVCDEGYQFDVDAGSCLDTNECETTCNGTDVAARRLVRRSPMT